MTRTLISDDGVSAVWALFDAAGSRMGTDAGPSPSARAVSTSIDFPAGTHDVGELRVQPGAVIRGAGRGLTVLRGRLTVADGTNVTISDLTIDCAGEPADTDGISITCGHWTTVRDVRIVHPKRDGLVIRSPKGEPSVFAVIEGVDVIAPGAGRGFALETVDGGWCTSVTMVGVSARGDKGDPIGTGFHFGPGCTDCTVVQSYAEIAGVGYSIEANRTRLIGSFADGCDVGFRIRADNLHALYPETWSCAKPWDVGGYLHTIIGRELVDIAGPISSLLVRSIDNVVRLADPRLHTIAMRSENRWDRVFALRDETADRDLLLADGDGWLHMPSRIRVGSIWLRDNSGTLEKSTDGATWTAA